MEQQQQHRQQLDNVQQQPPCHATTIASIDTTNNDNVNNDNVTMSQSKHDNTDTQTVVPITLSSSTKNHITTTTTTTTDPYVTANRYRQCAIDAKVSTVQQQQPEQGQQEQYIVHYINERPYIPQWRVEIVQNNNNNSSNSITNDTTTDHDPTTAVIEEEDDDPYYSIKSIATAILLLQKQQSSSSSLTTTTNTSTCQDIIPILPTIIPYLMVERVMGGVTNTLYKVSGYQSSYNNNNDSMKINTTTNTNTTTTTKSIHHFKISHFNVNDVLVRIFGAEGLIDRDDETCIFASLSIHGLAPMYYGRFANGRVEGYEYGMRPLQYIELHTGPISIRYGIATNLAKLHYGFPILPTLSKERCQPTIWKQLYDWYHQATKVSFLIPNNNNIQQQQQQVLESLHISTKIQPELVWLQEEVENVINANAAATTNSNNNTNNNIYYTNPIVFCHNDLLAANILYNDTNEKIQLIDFEYGGINYRSFDIANHFNEYAGGPPTECIPNYTLLPTIQQQQYFIRTYLEAATRILASFAVSSSSSSSSSTTTTSTTTTTTDTNTNTNTPTTLDVEEKDDTKSLSNQPLNNNYNNHNCNNSIIIDEQQVIDMMKEIEIFSLVNHLYWGLWAINQASNEGCTIYDYLTYGTQRIQQYWIQKQQLLDRRQQQVDEEEL